MQAKIYDFRQEAWTVQARPGDPARADRGRATRAEERQKQRHRRIKERLSSTASGSAICQGQVVVLALPDILRLLAEPVVTPEGQPEFLAGEAAAVLLQLDRADQVAQAGIINRLLKLISSSVDGVQQRVVLPDVRQRGDAERAEAATMLTTAHGG